MTVRFTAVATPASRALVALFLGLLLWTGAQAAAIPAEVPRHPLETQALADPQSVLKQLPALLRKAADARDFRETALLELARANACRVLADWACQREAGFRAHSAAEAADAPVLQVRGLIAESRGRISMQDFTRGEHLLGEAKRILQSHPFPELSADVYLAYSSLSYTLGKHAAAADYAQRGLTALGGQQAPTMRVRLLRNQANALAQLGQSDRAQALVRQGLALVEQLRDPKLSAELYLEDARIARLKGDVPSQVANGRKILVLAGELGNSQLDGLGHEVLGLAATGADPAMARRELRLAYESFGRLGVQRDERRVLRSLLLEMLSDPHASADLAPLARRLIALEASLDASDNALASDDFDARLKYEQQEFDVQRLEAAAALNSQRETTLTYQRRFALTLAGLSLLLLVVMASFFLAQRRFNVRLQGVIAQLRASEQARTISESRMRAVTDHIPAMIAHIDANQSYMFANAFTGDMLGVQPADMIGRTILEMRGETLYGEIKPHVEAVLRGETVSFEGCTQAEGNDFHYQSNFVPDRAPDGSVQGFFALTFDITQMKNAEAALDRLARVDSLTGLANRRQFEERLADALAHGRRHGEGIALLCVDIDHFKAINDSHGHPAGDSVLLAVANRLLGCVREEDVVARLGGDEFMLLLGSAQASTADNVAQKVLAAMQQPLIVGSHLLQVGTSIGVAFSPTEVSGTTLLSLVDQALYRAKAAGRNTYRSAEGTPPAPVAG